MALGHVNFAGATAYSARVLVKTNVRDKFAAWGGINYVNDPNMVAWGTSTVTIRGVDRDGLEIQEWRREGFTYSSGFANPTTNQPGYLTTRPVSDGTTFNPATDYVWFKEMQVEQGSLSTPYVNGTRSNTEAVIDLTRNTTLTTNSLTYNSDGSFEFNGIADKITTSTMPAMSNTNFSIECVVNAASLTTGNFFVSPISAGADHFLSIRTDGRARFLLTTSSDIGNRNYFTNTALQTNKNYHLVFVKNGSSVSIYVNGKLDFTTSADTLETASWGSAPWILGQRATGQFPFHGKLHVLRAYNKSLTSNEITQNYETLRGRYGI